jgi:hypothetical protein
MKQTCAAAGRRSTRQAGEVQPEAGSAEQGDAASRLQPQQTSKHCTSAQLSKKGIRKAEQTT